MNNYVGIWVSHGIAKIVNLSANGDYTLSTIESKIDKKRKSTSGKPSKTFYSHAGVTLTKYTDRVNQQLSHFYASILTKVAAADKILLMGPGIAKKELKNEISKRKNLAKKIVDIESSDKMTDPQLVARVKSRFGVKKNVKFV